MSDSLQPHGLYSPWNSPGQNTGVGSFFPSPADIPYPGIEPGSPALHADSLQTDQPRQHIKKQRHYFTNKVPSSESYGFSSSHVWVWDLHSKESWVPKNWCFWTVVLEKTLESPLDSKEMQPIHPKGNQSWIFIERTDSEAEPLILGHLMRRADSFEKTLMLGKIVGGRSGWQGMKCLAGITDSMDMSLSKL